MIKPTTNMQPVLGGELRRLDARGIQVAFTPATPNGIETVAVEMIKRGAQEYLAKDAPFIKLLRRPAGRVVTRLWQQKRRAKSEPEFRVLTIRTWADKGKGVDRRELRRALVARRRSRPRHHVPVQFADSLWGPPGE